MQGVQASAVAPLGSGLKVPWSHFVAVARPDIRELLVICVRLAVRVEILTKIKVFSSFVVALEFV